MDKITIYTDGSALGNPGPGGYGIVMLSGNYRKELSQGYKLTTNNRMELLAVIVALETLKIENSNVEIFSDSKYVVEAVENKWVYSWKQKKFKDKKNPDLWLRFLKIYEKHNVKLTWIKGHNKNKENEVCDKLAVAAAKSKFLLSDTYYENLKNSENELF